VENNDHFLVQVFFYQSISNENLLRFVLNQFILPFYMPQEDHLIYDVQHEQWQNHLYQVYEILHNAKIIYNFYA